MKSLDEMKRHCIVEGGLAKAACQSAVSTPGRRCLRFSAPQPLRPPAAAAAEASAAATGAFAGRRQVAALSAAAAAAASRHSPIIEIAARLPPPIRRRIAIFSIAALVEAGEVAAFFERRLSPAAVFFFACFVPYKEATLSVFAILLPRLQLDSFSRVSPASRFSAGAACSLAAIFSHLHAASQSPFSLAAVSPFIRTPFQAADSI
jgi:hypothetical protein